MSRFDQPLKVFRKVIAQAWIPAFLALAYAAWEFSSLLEGQRTTAAFIRSWGFTFFLIMWFAGQWLRVSKQIADAEQLKTLQQGMDKSLGILERLTEIAAAESPSLVHSTEPLVNEALAPPDEKPVSVVLHEIPKSPKGALLILGASLERELRQLLWASGWIQGVGKATIAKSVDHLVQLGVVPANLGNSVSAFLDIRNRLIHGFGATEDEVLRAVDVGLTILRAVLAIPREENRVYHAGVNIYEDESGSTLRPGIKAVVLECKSHGGSSKTLRAFPTTRTDFTRGQRVSWEWNTAVVVGHSWYRDPDTDQIVLGWRQSAEFVGRNLDNL